MFLCLNFTSFLHLSSVGFFFLFQRFHTLHHIISYYTQFSRDFPVSTMTHCSGRRFLFRLDLVPTGDNRYFLGVSMIYRKRKDSPIIKHECRCYCSICKFRMNRTFNWLLSGSECLDYQY